MFGIASAIRPEIRGITEWINSEPLTLQGLRGKVVLIDFWTFSCINCIRTQPYLNAWYDAYKGDGLVIIGVHAPEFEFEKKTDNVRRAVQDEKIAYPVALDNDYATWSAFDNHYWPAKYLINQEGAIVWTHFGEGAYDEAEHEIQKLLGKDTELAKNDTHGSAVRVGQTAETYLGYERGRNFANQSDFRADAQTRYTLAPVSEGSWSLGGAWTIGASGSTADEDGAVLRMGFSAKEVYLVMNGPAGAKATLKVNGKAATSTINGGEDVGPGGRIQLDRPRLYRLVKMPLFTENATLDVSLPKGVTVNAFTFGG